jgi:hypothetical protein
MRLAGSRTLSLEVSRETARGLANADCRLPINVVGGSRRSQPNGWARLGNARAASRDRENLQRFNENSRIAAGQAAGFNEEKSPPSPTFLGMLADKMKWRRDPAGRIDNDDSPSQRAQRAEWPHAYWTGGIVSGGRFESSRA